MTKRIAVGNSTVENYVRMINDEIKKSSGR